MNWLQAKAHIDQWQKEETLVKHKMLWTILWFQKKANLWSERSKMEDENLPLGHKYHATKQQKLWITFQKATEKFALCLPFSLN